MTKAVDSHKANATLSSAKALDSQNTVHKEALHLGDAAL
ncbi:hypothetical protein PESP_a1461 [Pseudoalteromonas espejiana DSM 9414]|nr:hypothetical protein PESP_a1461 [Pseudoalteromonas espejiana DSM 9414]